MKNAISNITQSGNLTKDPVLKTTQNGKTFCSFSIASNEEYAGNKNTTFVNCTAWGKVAEIINQHCQKGTSVCVIGSLKGYNDSNNNHRLGIKVSEFRFMPSAKPAQQQTQPAQPAQQQAAQQVQQSISGTVVNINPFDDSDVPF